MECLEGIYEGKNIEGGEKIAEFGNYPINGNWSPHLHFQVITDMLGKRGDFPGVCEPSRTDEYAIICLDANILLGVKEEGRIGEINFQNELITDN